MKKIGIVLCILIVFVLSFGLFGCGEPGGTPDGGTDGGDPPGEVSERYVGVTYAPWFPPQKWDAGRVWGTPLLGAYNSADREIIRQHLAWLNEYHVDFLMLDLTNGIDYGNNEGINEGNNYYIEDIATRALFEVFAEAEKAPKILLAFGAPDSVAALSDGRFQKKLDWACEDLIEPYGDLILRGDDGKPLVTFMIGAAVPAEFREQYPAFRDDRVNMRFFAGYLSSQPYMLEADAIEGASKCRLNYWSWWERGRNAYGVGADGRPECLTISAAWNGETCGWRDKNGNPGPDTVGRRDGKTFEEQWDLVDRVKPKYVVVNSFNEWVSYQLGENQGEEWTPEYSNDIEPSEEWGFRYMEILRDRGDLFRKLPK